MDENYYDSMWEIAKKQFVLGQDSIHGFDHWEAVYRNASMISKASGADIDIAKHFAIFHDCKRQDDEQDPAHGYRASEFIKSIRNQIQLDDAQFNTLKFAIEHHSKGGVSVDIHIGSCWDADRLELIRCNTCPNPELMSTDIGKMISEKMYEVKYKVSIGVM